MKAKYALTLLVALCIALCIGAAVFCCCNATASRNSVIGEMFYIDISSSYNQTLEFDAVHGVEAVVDANCIIFSKYSADLFYSYLSSDWFLESPLRIKIWAYYENLGVINSTMAILSRDDLSVDSENVWRKVLRDSLTRQLVIGRIILNGLAPGREEQE